MTHPRSTHTPDATPSARKWPDITAALLCSPLLVYGLTVFLGMPPLP